MSITPTLESTSSIANDQRMRTKRWIDQLGNRTFYSHCVNKKNLSKVFESGAILAGEQILRRAGTLEFEAGSMSRDRMEIRAPDVERIKSLADCISRYVKKMREYGLKKIISSMNETEVTKNSSDDSFLDRCRNLDECSEWDNWETSARKQLSKNVRKLMAVVWPALENKNAETEVEGVPSIAYRSSLIAIALDMSLPRDESLSGLIQDLFKAYDKLSEEKDLVLTRQRLQENALSTRDEILDYPTKIQATISVVANRTFCGYGPVAVLTSEPDSDLPIEKESCIRGEVRLPLVNRQNEFNRIDLSSEATLIVGERKVLEPFANSAYKANLVYTENLTPEMCRRLSVPYVEPNIGKTVQMDEDKAGEHDPRDMRSSVSYEAETVNDHNSKMKLIGPSCGMTVSSAMDLANRAIHVETDKRKHAKCFEKLGRFFSRKGTSIGNFFSKLGSKIAAKFAKQPTAPQAEV